MKIEKIEFKSVGVNLVGNLYLPNGFDKSKKYKAIVITPAYHQIKEQIPAYYGKKFVKKGFVVLGFDTNTKGESDSYSSNIRNDDNVFRKQEDLRNAISYLVSLVFVKKDGIYGLGVCLGANVMGSVVITDLRVKAFATISGMLTTDLIYWSNSMKAIAPFGAKWLLRIIGKTKYEETHEKWVKLITAANDIRQKVFEKNKGIYIDALDTPKDGYDPDYLQKHPEVKGDEAEGWDYYYTKRGGAQTHKRFTNNILGNYNEWAMINIAEHYADKIFQPFMGVVGQKAQTAILTKAFYRKVKSAKEFVKISKASHVDLYDKDEYADQAVDKISEFFDRY